MNEHVYEAPVIHVIKPEVMRDILIASDGSIILLPDDEF